MREDFFKELQFLVSQPALKNAVESRAAFRPATAISEDELCRQAILRVGTEEQFGASSHALLLAKSLYPQVRDALLLTGSWTWATKSTTLTEALPRPEFKWGHRYALPSDCLRVFRVNEQDLDTEEHWEVSGAFIHTDSESGAPAWISGRSYSVGNGVSNGGAVYRCLVAGTTKEPGVTAAWTTDWEVWLGSVVLVEYIARETDATRYDSLFIDLLTSTLAAKLAVPLIGDNAKAKLLASEVDLLGKSPAMRRDSTERKGRIKPAWMGSKLVGSRNGGDGSPISKKSSGGAAGGVSYPALLIQVGDVTANPAGTPPTVTNTGTAGTAILNFGLPQAGLLASSKTTLAGNGSTKTFTVTGLKSSDPNHVIVAINGVTQEPTTDYTVSQGAGTITFSSAPPVSKIVVVALGLYSPAAQRDPDNYIHAFALNTAGTFSYYGVLLNADISASGSPAAVAKWEITRSALATNGTITSTAKATNVAWNNRETAAYA